MAGYTRDQQKALQDMRSGKNVFLTGGAGVGKSYIINCYLQEVKNTKKVIVVAPTGIAAQNVGGATIHHVFGCGIKILQPDAFNRKPGDALKQADIIFLDEVSMCRMDVFTFVINTIKQAQTLRKRDLIESGCGKETAEEMAHKQLIFAGDFYQLPPVLTNADRAAYDQIWRPDGAPENWDVGDPFAFLATVWQECNFAVTELKETVRQQQPDLVLNLNKARVGDVSCIEWFNSNLAKKELKNAVMLCASNALANSVNTKKIESLPGKEYAYKIIYQDSAKNTDIGCVPELLRLKKGAQVMVLINAPGDGKAYQNGSMGTVVKCADNSVKVKIAATGEVEEFTQHTWPVISYTLDKTTKKFKEVQIGSYSQIPLKLAYASTVHKSQGQTYDRVNIAPDCFLPGQLYVALSRGRTAQGIHLLKPILPEYLKTSEQVKKFYATFSETPEEKTKKIEQTTELEQIDTEITELQQKIALLQKKKAELMGNTQQQQKKQRGRKSSFTQEQQKKILMLSASGHTTRQIGAELGVNASTICRFLKKWGG